MRVFGVTGWKNSGKTTLITKLISHFAGQGMRVATVKHAHKGFDVDHPGRDSHQHRTAGAAEVLVSSPRRWALMGELREAPELDLDTLLGKLGPSDLVLVEGFKTAPHPKVEVFDASAGASPIADGNPTIKAMALTGAYAGALPRFDRDDIAGIAAFILAELQG